MTSPRTMCFATMAAFTASCKAPEPLIIGVVSGGEGLAGARFAAAEINRSGGVRGRPVVLRLIEAGGTDARSALIAAESLSRDRSVLAVVGHSNSSASLAASRVYNTRRVVQIAPTSSGVALAKAGPFTFRLVGSDVHQARFIADELIHRGTQAVAVFYVNDEYGRSLFHELRDRLRESRVRIDLAVPYSETDELPDGEAAVQTIRGSGTTDLIWLGRTPHLRQLVGLLRRGGSNVRILASDGVAGRELADNRRGLFSGIQYVCLADVGSERPQMRSLRDNYEARTGRDLTAELAFNYDAVMLVGAAASESGRSRGAIHRYLTTLGTRRDPFPGVTGDIVFGEDGGAPPSYCLAEVTADGVRVRPTATADR